MPIGYCCERLRQLDDLGRNLAGFQDGDLRHVREPATTNVAIDGAHGRACTLPGSDAPSNIL
jgi:hypothetical protein